MKREKMSKSRGNVVTVDEIAYGVHEVSDGYEFRNVCNEVIDFKQWGVWRDKGKTGFYYSSTRSLNKPVFLCEIGGDPCVLLINGEEKVQHPNVIAKRWSHEGVEWIAYECEGSERVIIPYVVNLEEGFVSQ